MAGIKKIGEKTEYGKVAAIMWIGERYYLLLKDGAVSLMPASTIEARPTVRAKRPVQQAKVKISTRVNCDECNAISKQFNQCGPGTGVMC